MKTIYETPELFISQFENMDIITTSGWLADNDETDLII